MSVVVTIAEAVVAELNASGLLGGATAGRHYRATFDLRDMKDLHVTVVPKGKDFQGASRSMVQEDVQIDVGVQRKLATSDQAEIDGLMGLVEQLADWLRGRQLTGAPDAVWVRTENVPVYSPEHLEQLRQFTSVLTLTYRVLR